MLDLSVLSKKETDPEKYSHNITHNKGRLQAQGLTVDVGLWCRKILLNAVMSGKEGEWCPCLTYISYPYIIPILTTEFRYRLLQKFKKH